MRILIVVPSQDRVSGNWITACRFQRGLEKRGHLVVIHDTQLQPRGSLRQRTADFTPDIALLLHAYRSGKPWLTETADMHVPSVVMLTGTDINHGLGFPEEREIIRAVLEQAHAVLVHNPLIADQLRASRAWLATRLHLLPPGILLGETLYDLRGSHALAKDLTLFLCPAGLRPVKGVLPLLEMFDLVASQRSDFQVAFCGPQLDADYSRRFLAEVKERGWARYIGSIPPDAMASAMRGSDVILNNSQSEGLANALIEASAIGIPILARRIPGNAALVRHNCNGLLYDNLTEFRRYALQLLDGEKRRELICPDARKYDPDLEAAELADILNDAASSRRHR
jgi:glycosyltransferase involved in cell wall biosynthesis